MDRGARQAIIRYIILLEFLFIITTPLLYGKTEIIFSDNYKALKGRIFISNTDIVILKYISSIKNDLELNWVIIKPELNDYSNIPEHHSKENLNLKFLSPIKYEKIIKISTTSKFRINLKNITKINIGTLYVGVEISSKNQTDIKSIIPDKIETEKFLPDLYPGQIIQFVFSSGNTYIDHLKELWNTPFILGARENSNGKNQIDWVIGSDCASFAIYGQRRLGKNIPYCGPRFIYRYLTPIYKSSFIHKTNENREVYINSNNEFLKIGKNQLTRGDIIHTGEHVMIFYKDRGEKGILDGDDLIIQSYIPTPSIIPISKSEFYHQPIRVFKWK